MKKLALSCAIAGAMMSLCASVQAAEPIDPIEPVEVKNPALVELGKMLFFEPRLSRSGFISCNSCHNLATGGVDNLQTSIGDRWAQGPINSPTVLNSFGQVAQFWDGRAKTLAEQAAGPIANPLEMAHSVRQGMFSIVSLIPAISLLVCIIPMFFYNLTGDFKDKIESELAQQREAKGITISK